MDVLNKRLSAFAVLIPVIVILLTLSNVFTKVGSEAILGNDPLLGVRYKSLVDSEHRYSAEKAHELFSSIEETELNSTLIGISDDIYWYQIELNNNYYRTRDITVFIDNPMIDKLDVYDATRQYSLLAQLGDKRLFNSPELLAFPSTTISIKPNETKVLLFKTESTGPNTAFFLIYDQKGFSQHKGVVYLIMGGLIGTVLLMCIYNLILYTGVKDKLYLLYIGYVGLFLVDLSAIHGFLGYLFPVQIIDFISSNIISMQFAISYFAILFGLYFLEFDKEPERPVTRYTKKLSYFYLLAAFISLFIEEKLTAPVFFLAQLVLYGFAGYFIYIKLKERVRWVNFYLFSWLPLLVGGVIAPLLVLGFIEYSLIANFALLFGVMFEMTFISMGLAERLRNSENKRLYEANHDNVFNLPNINLLNERYTDLTDDHRTAKFSLVLIRIGKYASIVPYIAAEQLKNLVEQFAKETETHFSTELTLHAFDSKSALKHVVMIREGVFALLVDGDDQSALNRAIKQFAQRQPLPFKVDQLSINFNCYISAVAYQKDTTALNDLISSGLQEIEVAISNGRNYGIFNSESHKAVQRKVQLASDLSKALESNEFYLAHQPQIDLKTKDVVGSEVLIRWQHEEFGFVPPDEFIKIAEQTGAINKISEWVFSESCRHLVKLIEQGHSSHKLSVNISVYDVSNDDFIWYLVQTINKYNLTADMFILELTETALVDDLSRFRRNVLHLKELGFGLAIDDFGTGYSSLIYVSKHPFDEIKIDREFVFFLTQSDTDKTIVSTTITMAKSLDIKVVAEGIEDHETGELLLDLGCDIVQGYYYSKPLKFDDYLGWLSQQSQQSA